MFCCWSWCAAITRAINPRFLSRRNLSNTANLVGLYGIFSIGTGLVIITGGIDLSVGSMIALNGVLFVDLLTEWHWPWPLALLCGPRRRLLLGAPHGLLITRFKMQPFIVTLCGLLMYRGIARYFAHDTTRGFGDAAELQSLHKICRRGMFVACPHLHPAHHHLRHHVGGAAPLGLRALPVAVGKNEEATRFSGVNTHLIIGASYVRRC